MSARLSNQVRFWAWASLVSEILIVVTGGVVRLTGSGLGCTDWPECTAGHLTTTPAQGYHGAIEFGNRMLTGVLIIIAVATLLAVRGAGMKAVGFKSAKRMAWVLIAGIFVQAVVGGVTVWIKLIPWLVGVHFILSAIMILLSTTLVWRVYQPKRSKLVPIAYVLAAPQAVLGAIVIFIGVLTTGSGPHAGDANSVRNGLSFDVVEKYHSVPAYLLLAVEVAVFVALWRARGASAQNSLAARVAGALLAVTIAQAILGVVQTYLVSPAVPALLVGFHMFGAAMLISALTFSWLSLRGSKALSVELSSAAAASDGK